MPQSPIIITGAAGFIGSVLAHSLNQLGETDLILVDSLGSSPSWKNLVPLKFREYLDREAFLLALKSGRFDSENVRGIFHLGACSSTTESDAGFLMRNNYEYSRAIALWCASRPNPVRFIYASSAATYGDGSSGYEDDLESIESLRPLNAYAYSKQAFDLWMKREGFFSFAVGLKYFNVYGPNEYHKGDMKSMVAKAHAQIKETGKVQLFKSHRPDFRDGEQLRDFIHVQDAVDMTLHFLKMHSLGGLFNVGTGKARSWVDMMRAVFAAMGREECIEFIPMPTVLQGKYQYFTEAPMHRLRATEYLKPFMSLEDGVAAYIPYLEMGEQILGWS